MGLTSLLAKRYAGFRHRRIDAWRRNAVEMQDKIFWQLLEKGKNTRFGRDHSIRSIADYEGFRSKIPVSDYESLMPYIDRMRQGERDVLWPGRPKYYVKTSGTTSGPKYVPLTSDSIPNHIDSARNALLNYIVSTGKTGFLEGNYIFLSGSPELDDENGVPTGRLSGIVNHHVPFYIRKKQLPSWKVNCLEDWEVKLDGIVDETVSRNMSLISGIPPWVEMYFERLLARSGKSTIMELFPDFGLYIHGGMNFQPYEQKFKRLIGGDVDLLETFPASEGFFAFQDEFPSKGLLLIPDSGIFYEFIPLEAFNNGKFGRIPLEGIETGINYLMVITTNAGFWGYNTGDTVSFTSRDPYRLVVTGRVTQFTSAFGEHVIAAEVESAIDEACRITGAAITEFTVAPLVDNPDGLPCHEWFIEFSKNPASLEKFRTELDRLMREKNVNYRDLVNWKVLQPLIVRIMPENSFAKYMKSIGKLGSQNKVPHLKNDRSMAGVLNGYLQSHPKK